MSHSHAQNLVIGPIAQVETTTDAGYPLTTITINHEFWDGNYKNETTYRFTFHNVPEKYLDLYEEGNLVMVKFELIKGDHFDYKIKPTQLAYLGDPDENTPTIAFNHITGVIGNHRHGDHNGKSYVRIAIPHEKYERGNKETLWLNFSYWRVHPDLHFLYEKGCAVSLDYTLINREDGNYDIRPLGRLNLIKGNPKYQEPKARKTQQSHKKATT
ncbi:MAG: hypothetical protein QNK37_37220 [Acidobacteriota bacterium]|nr:hypothetical protein [Acidobacteriota bacterium]